MLQDDEKAKIRAEEIFRSEIRRELDASKPPRSRRERLWALLNSSFILWFFSSVILTGVTGVFAIRQSNRNNALKSAEVERRIATEISYRIKQALAGVRQDQANFRNGRAYAPDGYYTNIVRYLDNSFLADKNDPRDFSFYPEYRDLKFEPLVANLMPQETPARQTSLKRAVEIYNAFLARSEMGHEDWVTIGAPPNERPTEVAMKQSREALVEASKILESDLLTIFLQWSGFPGD